jgi:histidyl-tRNA synthetase
MEAAARLVLNRACFSEIRTPVFERTELFERGVGEATEVVEKQMYTFESRSGKDRITLRPENTAGVVRAFLQHGLRTESPLPLKLWYLGPMFRYERPQRGRQRQFHQLGVETIGSGDPRADAEVILVACEFLRECGLDDLVVDLNSLGDPEDRDRYRKALVEYLTSVKDQLDEDAAGRIDRSPLRVLDSKNEQTREAVKQAPSILEFLGDESREQRSSAPNRPCAAAAATMDSWRSSAVLGCRPSAGRSGWSAWPSSSTRRWESGRSPAPMPVSSPWATKPTPRLSRSPGTYEERECDATCRSRRGVQASR